MLTVEPLFPPGGLVVNGTQFVPSEPAPLAAYLEHARALPSDDPADLLGVRASTGRVIAAAAAETLLERAAVLWGGTADGSERTEDLQQVGCYVVPLIIAFRLNKK